MAVEIHVPTAKMSDTLGFGQAPLFLLQHQFRAFQRRDIQGSSAHDQRLAVFGKGEFAPAHDPVHAAVGPDHPVGMGKRHMVAQAVGQQGLHFG